jgi:tetratricopeptide (TPR) repeat protein
VKRPQIILIGSGVILLALLAAFGKIMPSSQPKIEMANQPPQNSSDGITTESILSEAKKHISATLQQRIAEIEQVSVDNSDNLLKIKAYEQLATLWKDSAQIAEPFLYYTAEAAKLENSEKNLNFAARLLVDNLLAADNPAIQHWLAMQAQVLLEKSLVINPNNDSAQIGLGACYMLGNISDNPMQGILKVREIVEQRPDNLYAQYVLGVGGKKSGQYDKAMEHFSAILHQQPNNLEAAFQLAECAELKGDKATAIKWYEHLKEQIPNLEIKQEIAQRIQSLQ